MTTPSPSVLYDGECALCRRVVSVASRRHLDAIFVPLSESSVLEHGLDHCRTRDEVAYVHPSGDVVYGYRAIAAALRRGGRVARAIGTALTWPLVGSVADRVYKFVSAHRRRTPVPPKNH